MNLQQKVVKGLIWSAIQDWGSQAVNFAIFFILARLLGPEVFGLVALSQVFLRLVQTVIKEGFTQALVQRKDLDLEHLDTAFWINVGIAVLLTIVCTVSAGQVAIWFKQPELTSIIPWLSINFILASLNDVQQAILSRKLDFKSLATRTLIAMPVSGVVGVAMAFLGFGVWSIVVKQLVDRLIQVIVLWKVSDWRPGFHVSLPHFKELFAFQSNIMGISILAVINGQSDNFLIGYFLGPKMLGYYVVAYQLTQTLIGLLSGATSRVALPAFSQLQHEKEQLRQAFYKVTQIASLVAFPIFFGIMALAPELVEVVFGKQWLPAVPVMQILSLAGILQSVHSFLGVLITALGKPAWNFQLNLLSVTAQVVSFAVVVHWGITAIAIAYVAVGYLFNPIRLLLIKKLIQLDIKIYSQQYITPILSTLGFVATILATRYLWGTLMNSQVFLVVATTLGLAVYLSLMRFISPKLFGQIRDLVLAVVQKTRTKVAP